MINNFKNFEKPKRILYTDTTGKEKLFIVKTKKSNPIQLNKIKASNKKNSPINSPINSYIEFRLNDLRNLSNNFNFGLDSDKNFKKKNIEFSLKYTLPNQFFLSCKHFK